MEFVFLIICFFLVSILIYFGAIKLIKMWTGSTDSEAVNRLQHFVSGAPLYKLEEDIGLQNEIWENVKKIIGEKRYQQLIDLNSTMISMPLLFYGFESGLPFIGVSLYYMDENEKMVLANIIVNVVKKFLRIYSYDTAVLVVWKERYDLQMPFIQIRYAKNDEQKRILHLGIKNQQQIIATKNSVVIDDTEDEIDE